MCLFYIIGYIGDDLKGGGKRIITYAYILSQDFINVNSC